MSSIMETEEAMLMSLSCHCLGHLSVLMCLFFPHRKAHALFSFMQVYYFCRSSQFFTVDYNHLCGGTDGATETENALPERSSDVPSFVMSNDETFRGDNCVVRMFALESLKRVERGSLNCPNDALGLGVNENEDLKGIFGASCGGDRRFHVL
jgi:hypothetical protein